MRRLLAVVGAALLLHQAGGVQAQAPTASPTASPQTDVHVPSRPETITWGAFPIDKKPVATVKPGQTVRIDTLSHAGSTQEEAPAAATSSRDRSTWTAPNRATRSKCRFSTCRRACRTG